MNSLLLIPICGILSRVTINIFRASLIVTIYDNSKDLDRFCTSLEFVLV